MKVSSHVVVLGDLLENGRCRSASVEVALVWRCADGFLGPMVVTADALLLTYIDLVLKKPQNTLREYVRTADKRGYERPQKESIIQ